MLYIPLLIYSLHACLICIVYVEIVPKTPLKPKRPKNCNFSTKCLITSPPLDTSTSRSYNQPFGMVMEKSGVETRSSEQTMIPDEVHVLLVTIAPQRRIQRQMTSPIPPEVHALTWQGYVVHIVRMVSCIAMSFA